MTKQSSTRIPYLKNGVRLRTKSYVLLGVAVIVWLSLDTPVTLPELREAPFSAWVLTAFTTVFSALVVAVDSLPGPNGKAMLVFWRRREPLPGSRAFQKANLDADSRIDRQRLRQVVGGKLPRAAKDQNTTWYRLYKGVENDEIVQAIHFDYLLFRDLAWLSVVLCVLALVNLFRGPPSAELLGFGALAFVLLYLVFRRAAAERGQRFVNQVLVTACTNHQGA